MDNENIFTVTLTGANHEVRTFISDCVIVIAHKDGDDFNMSINNASNIGTTVMLLEAMEQAKQQILNSNSNIQVAYDLVQKAKEDNNA